MALIVRFPAAASLGSDRTRKKPETVNTAEVVPFPSGGAKTTKKAPIHAWDRLGPYQRALLRSDLGDAEKLAAVAIIGRLGFNDDAFPAMQTIATDVRKSLRTIERAIGRLVEQGWLIKSKARVGNRNGSNRYKPNYDKARSFEADESLATPSEMSGSHADLSILTPSPVTSHPVTHDALPPSPVTLSPRHPCRSNVQGNVQENEQQECSIEARGARTDRDLDGEVRSSEKRTRPAKPKTIYETDEDFRAWCDRAFSNFWSNYPLKVGKKAAKESFVKIMSPCEGHVFDELMDGLDRYIKSIDDPKYILHPSTWLNNARWEDHPPPRKPKSGNLFGMATPS